MAALVLGSHAMHDSFAVIRWNAAGVGSAAASVLWSESVAAEVILFFVLGPMLLDPFGPARRLSRFAIAGV
jgi:PPP family 3-phenylpropionic acid transporter